MVCGQESRGEGRGEWVPLCPRHPSAWECDGRASPWHTGPVDVYSAGATGWLWHKAKQASLSAPWPRAHTGPTRPDSVYFSNRLWQSSYFTTVFGNNYYTFTLFQVELLSQFVSFCLQTATPTLVGWETQTSSTRQYKLTRGFLSAHNSSNQTVFIK